MIQSRLFGFEIFIEIEQELEKIKNIYPYSDKNEAYNVIVDLCKQAVKDVADRRKSDLSNPVDRD
jgi:hypothetical protein